jgi:hypothetical protein
MDHAQVVDGRTSDGATERHLPHSRRPNAAQAVSALALEPTETTLVHFQRLAGNRAVTDMLSRTAVAIQPRDTVQAQSTGVEPARTGWSEAIREMARRAARERGMLPEEQPRLTQDQRTLVGVGAMTPLRNILRTIDRLPVESAIDSLATPLVILRSLDLPTGRPDTLRHDAANLVHDAQITLLAVKNPSKVRQGTVEHMKTTAANLTDLARASRATPAEGASMSEGTASMIEGFAGRYRALSARLAEATEKDELRAIRDDLSTIIYSLKALGVPRTILAPATGHVTGITALALDRDGAIAKAKESINGALIVLDVLRELHLAEPRQEHGATTGLAGRAGSFAGRVTPGPVSVPLP